MAVDAADEDEAVLVADDGHAAVVRPGEVGDAVAAVVDELDGPAALVLDPHVDEALGVAGGELLVGLVPADEPYVVFVAAQVEVGAVQVVGGGGAAFGRGSGWTGAGRAWIGCH